MAEKFRKIDPRIWNDEGFRALPRPLKLVAFYLITGPQTNRIGLYMFSLAMGAEILGYSLKEFSSAVEAVCDQLSWAYDQDARVLYIPSWWKYNPPANPKNLKGNLKDLHDVPDSKLIALFEKNDKFLPDHCLEAFRETISIRMRIRMGKGMPSQEQEQEQEQEQDAAMRPAVGGSSADGPDPANKLAEETGLAINVGPKQRGELRRLIGISGYEIAKNALLLAISRGCGGRGAIAYAEKVVAGEKAKEALKSQAPRQRSGRAVRVDN